jgi:antagonist of KipI
MTLTVLRAGFLTTVQDLGRCGFREFGVSLGGALDSYALRVMNLLVGNEKNAAGLEFATGNVRVRFDEERIIAWAGGEYDIVAGGRRIPAGHSALVTANEALSISGPRRGTRGWLAVSGGINVSRVLESRSTDLRGGFGGFEGRTLLDGDVLPVGDISERARVWINHLRKEQVAPWSGPADWSSPAQRKPVLRVVRGSGWDLFNDVTRQRFTSDAFTVSPDSDRMGARLDGCRLRRNQDNDLVSEAVAPGTVQVPPSGNPIVLLGDCQTIGGYPKIAHVITVDLPITAQLRAGDTIRFCEVSMADAHRLLFERERDLEQFQVGIKLHMP